MTHLRYCLIAIFAGILAVPAYAQAAGSNDRLVLDLSTGGRVEIDLFEDSAPKSAARLKTLARSGFYNGLMFHRVIDTFLAQTGDPTGIGGGGSRLPNLRAELSRRDFRRGTVAMAHLADINGANSQFFICFTDTGCSFLVGQYTIVAQVTKGMPFVDKLPRGEPADRPGRIVRAMVVTAR